MIAEAPGPINFTMFLTVFGDRAQGTWAHLTRNEPKLNDNLILGTDDEQTIVNAFSQYDEGDGTCSEET